MPEAERKDLDIALTATFTLLALIIGFSFSMAITRYDLRKTYEAAEASAIRTVYLRADFLPNTEAAKLRELLKTYVRQRVSFYMTSNSTELRQLDVPTPISALVAAGMNGVFSAEGNTAASWSNRLPLAAWALMTAIAICANLLLGYISLVLPLATSIAFFLIAEIESPRGGLISVLPENLRLVAQAMTVKG